LSILAVAVQHNIQQKHHKDKWLVRRESILGKGGLRGEGGGDAWLCVCASRMMAAIGQSINNNRGTQTPKS